MISHRDSNKVFKKILAYSIGILCIVFVWRPVESVLLRTLEATGFFSSRVFKCISQVHTNVYLYMASNNALYEENKKLEAELESEKEKYLELALLRDQIRKYENFTSTTSTPSFFATRIGFIDMLAHNTFRINKGEGDSVLPQMLVIGSQNTVVGSVSEVGVKTSLVSLFWNGREFNGRTSASGTVITLRGVDDGVYKAEVPHEMDFQIGDLVVYDTNPEFVIGVIKKINNNEEDRFKEIFVFIPFHPSMIDVVRLEPSV